MKKVFASLHARTICHATEDLERVKAALASVVGDAEQRITRSEGHHGNPIVVLESRVDDPKTIDDFFKRLEAETSAALINTLECRIDEACNMFVKLDKQSAFAGVLREARNDDVVSVRIKVSAFPARPEVARRAVEAHLKHPS